MTEEELKDEICEYVHNLHKVEPFNGFSYRDLRDVAEHFALPREKRIAELTEQNTSLLTSVENLNKSVQELEAQIEKMKQCGNCGNGTIGNCEHCKRKPKQKSTDTNDYWKLKEIKENDRRRT